MNALMKNLKPVVWLMGIGAASMTFAFTTFATIKYVDDKNTEVQKNISELKGDAKDTKSMVMDLYRDQLGREPKFAKHEGE